MSTEKNVNFVVNLCAVPVMHTVEQKSTVPQSAKLLKFLITCGNSKITFNLKNWKTVNYIHVVNWCSKLKCVKKFSSVQNAPD